MKRLISLTGFIMLVTLAGVFTLVLYAQGPVLAEKHLAKISHRENPAQILTKNSLKIVTYNIGYASGEKNNTKQKLTKPEVIKNLDEIANTLKALDADIIGLQEVDFFAKRTFNINQAAYLAQKLAMPYMATAVTWNKKYVAWPYWPPTAHFGRIVSGQNVLSRYPIQKQQVLKYEKPQDNPFWYNWFYLNRMVQKLTIQVKNTEITVWHVHLEAFSKKTRFEQMHMLGTWLAEQPTKTQIVLGDFNDEFVKPVLDKAHLLMADNSAFPTYPSPNPTEKIDHILYDSGMKLKRVGVLAKFTASDHLPVWAEFDLP